jgi:hypothetical protein
MDDSVTGGAGAGTGGGTGGGSGSPSVWAQAPAWVDSPTFDVAVGSGTPTPPTSTVDLGLNATTVYGLNFNYTGGMYSQTQLGAEQNIQISPLALVPGEFGAAWRAAAASNLNCTLGPAANILFGRQITINHGPEEIKFSSDGKNLKARTLVLLIAAVAAAYGIACYLLADNEIWAQDKEGNLVAYYQAAMEILLTVCLVDYVSAAKAEEVATAAEFELLINDHMGTAATP